MGGRVPSHWDKNSWEEKAKENPLFAVMTVPKMAGAAAAEFRQDQLEAFFAKGTALFSAHIAPLIAIAPEVGEDARLIAEYGCGAGRILRAVTSAGHKAAGIDISPTMI